MEQKQEEYLRLLKEAISGYFYITYIQKRHIDAYESTYKKFVYANIKKPLINKNIMDKYAILFNAITSVFELYEIQKNEVLTTNTYIVNILLRDLYIDYLQGKIKGYDQKLKVNILNAVNDGIKKQYAKLYSIQDILVFCLKALDLQPVEKEEEIDKVIKEVQKEYGQNAVFSIDEDENGQEINKPYTSKIDIVEYIINDFKLEKNNGYIALKDIINEIKDTKLYLSDYAFILELTQNDFKLFRKKMLTYDKFTDKILYDTNKTYSIEETIRKNIELPMKNNRVNIKTYFEHNKLYKVDDEFLMFLDSLRQDLYIKFFDKYKEAEEKESEGNQ